MAKYVKRYREDVVVSSPLRQIYLTGRPEGVYPQPFLLRITLIMDLLNRIFCHERQERFLWTPFTVLLSKIIINSRVPSDTPGLNSPLSVETMKVLGVVSRAAPPFSKAPYDSLS